MRLLSIIFTCVITLALSSLTAQTMVGLRVLSGSSSLTSPRDVLPDNLGTHTRVAGTTFGLVVERDLTYRLSIRSGIQQTQRGTMLQQGKVSQLLGSVLPRDYEAQIRMNYLEIPLSLKFSLPLAQDQVELFGWGGATAGYALTGSVRSSSATALNFQLTTSKIDMVNYTFPRLHFGYTGGLGLALNLGETLQVRLEAEYNRSIEEKAMLSPESGDHAYQVLHFGAGMVFRL